MKRLWIKPILAALLTIKVLILKYLQLTIKHAAQSSKIQGNITSIYNLKKNSI